MIVISVSFSGFWSTRNPFLPLLKPCDADHVTYIQDGGQINLAPKITNLYLQNAQTYDPHLSVVSGVFEHEESNFGAKNCKSLSLGPCRDTFVISVLFPRFSSTRNPILPLPNTRDAYHVTYIQDGAKNYQSISEMRGHAIVIPMSFPGVFECKEFNLGVM